MHTLNKYLFILITLFTPSIANATDIQVKIDRASIQLNETFTLVFEANDDVDADPDFSPLKQDFQVLRQSTGSNISLINGKYTKSLRWNVSLMALKEGTITIPSISFGKDKSPASQITINPVKKSNGQAGEKLISELEISTDSAYPQSQIIITQRMLSSRNINGYEFSALTMSGVDTVQEPLGELKQYQTKRGDTPYLVLEQNYAVYPQSDGQLQIEPSVASARVSIDNSSQFNAYRGNSKTVRRASDKKIILVQPVPSSFKGKHWLPANEVQLVEEFPETSSFNVGEPITRTLSLLADGQSASQLPEFLTNDIENLKQYPDKPLLNDNKSDDGITGIQQIKVAIIPSKEGSYSLPAMTIPWWNIKTNKLESANIPARTFKVGKSLSTVTADIIKPTPDQTTIAPVTEPVTPAASQLQETQPSGSLAWKMLSLLLATGWAITLFILWNTKRQLFPSIKNTPQESPSLKQAVKKIQNACDNSNAQSCKDALLIWAKLVFKDQPVYSLGELSARVTSPLAEKIKELNSHIYKDSSEPWACVDLLNLCEEYSKTYDDIHINTKNSNQLDELYP